MIPGDRAILVNTAADARHGAVVTGSLPGAGTLGVEDLGPVGRLRLELVLLDPLARRLREGLPDLEVARDHVARQVLGEPRVQLVHGDGLREDDVELDLLLPHLAPPPPPPPPPATPYAASSTTHSCVSATHSSSGAAMFSPRRRIRSCLRLL